MLEIKRRGGFIGRRPGKLPESAGNPDEQRDAPRSDDCSESVARGAEARKRREAESTEVQP